MEYWKYGEYEDFWMSLGNWIWRIFKRLDIKDMNWYGGLHTCIFHVLPLQSLNDY